MQMLLFLAILFVGGAVIMLGEVATYPTRLRSRSVKRATDYGRTRVGRNEQELIRFRERVIAPMALKLAKIPMKVTPNASAEAMSSKIVAAGLAQRLTVANYLAIKGGCVVGGAVLGVVFAALISFTSVIVIAPVLAAVGMIAPDWVLSFKIRSRRDAVRAELPDALDLLAVSVEAGLGFDGAVTKLIDHMSGPLIDEFALTLNEIRVGETRAVALKKMAERVDALELSNFVRAVVQAEQLGISLGRILRVQAADTRMRRQAAAEEKAMKAPIKMLFPTVFFIFPAMFIVILGPAMLNIMKIFK
jgi:tight adherence protein C